MPELKLLRVLPSGLVSPSPYPTYSPAGGRHRSVDMPSQVYSVGEVARLHL